MPFMSRPVASHDQMSTSMPIMMESNLMPRTNMKRVTDGAVVYIPSMMDSSCGTMPMHHRMTPIGIMMNEMKIMLQNIMMCLPEMAQSIWMTDLSGRNTLMSMSGLDMVECCLQMMLGLMEMCCVTLLPMACMVMPGAFMMPVCLMCVCMVMMMCWPMNGQQIMRCPSPALRSEMMADERWIFINGSMTSSRQMMNHLRRISMIFCRPITGVHNRTYGPVLDVISPMMMTLFNTSTSTSMALHAEMRDAMMSPNCNKVIIMAHGTGAAILSHVLDRMHCDMPMAMMNKMEIYTFGSAARHLSNPCMMMERPLMNMQNQSRSSIMDMMMRNEEMERVIPHVEHYAMSTDLFAQTGILHHTLNELNNRFCGRTFLMSRPGFLFTQYMEMLFPVTSSKRGSLSMTSGMLDKVVDVDVMTAEKREFTAQGMMGGMGISRMGKRCNHQAGSAQCAMCMSSRCAHAMGSGLCSICMTSRCNHAANSGNCAMCMPSRCSHTPMSGTCAMCTRCSHDMNAASCTTCMDIDSKDIKNDPKMSNGEKKDKITNGDGLKDIKKERATSWGMGVTGMGDSVAMVRLCAKQAEGKTMKELSRLWRYQGGNRPGPGMGMGDDVMGTRSMSMMNGRTEKVL